MAVMLPAEAPLAVELILIVILAAAAEDSAAKAWENSAAPKTL